MCDGCYKEKVRKESELAINLELCQSCQYEYLEVEKYSGEFSNNSRSEKSTEECLNCKKIVR